MKRNYTSYVIKLIKKKKDIATYLLKWPTSGTLVSRNAGEDMEQKEL